MPGTTRKTLIRATAFAAAVVAIGSLGQVAGFAGAAHAATHGPTRSVPLIPGNLLVSTSTFDTTPHIVPGTTQLPLGCTGANCVTAIADGTYPYVFNNDTVDANFGVTSPISLDEVTPSGRRLGSIIVPAPTNSRDGLTSGAVTSFSSKSEVALNLSTSGKYLTFMGYQAPDGGIDVSNSNTPGVVDPTNPDPLSYYRVVAKLSQNGKFTFTNTNAYSGNNGRAAILDDNRGSDSLFTVGNAGNGSNPQPAGVVLGAGAQIIKPSTRDQSEQDPGQPTPVGSFSVTELGSTADKVGKDDNFRGLTVSNNVLYYTKGSGSNGVDTVYFLDTTGTACPTGVGIPAPGAALPSTALADDAATGLTNNMCILRGFPTTSAKVNTTSFPFGLWFANSKTLYVADEGNGTTTFDRATGTYTAAAASTTAGLQKWTFDSSTGSWQLAYTLQSGLKLGQPYRVAGYPTGTNAVTNLPWAPATDGLRNITGRLNRDGTVSIWAVTSTVSGGGDIGADPNQLLTITDRLAASSPAHETFRTVTAPENATVVRGVSFTPGTQADRGR
ncbi:MAG: hypothetical protein JWP75_1702 [Frondihabitans sp.]|nr:hypothetical protein [Frondihabitans sp.]